PEPALDQAAVAEQGLELLGRGIGGHVEVLGLQARQQVAHRAPHQMGLVPALAQPVQHAQRCGADVLAGDGMAVARDAAQLRYGRGVVLCWHQVLVGGRRIGGRERFRTIGEPPNPAILASCAAEPVDRRPIPARGNAPTLRSLRLVVQDAALSRLKHGFESRRERHISAGYPATGLPQRWPGTRTRPRPGLLFPGPPPRLPYNAISTQGSEPQCLSSSPRTASSASTPTALKCVRSTASTKARTSW